MSNVPFGVGVVLDDIVGVISLDPDVEKLVVISSETDVEVLVPMPVRPNVEGPELFKKYMFVCDMISLTKYIELNICYIFKDFEYTLCDCPIC